MGEKFSVNPVTGTASFEIPIATSPGRAGVQPSLSVAFDSGAGNGPFGHGFIDPGTGERIERYVRADRAAHEPGWQRLLDRHHA